MKDKELLERCHDGECVCDGCERRFICWTTKRVFSDPVQQALYEAHIAEGLPHDEALHEVREVIERAVSRAAMEEEMRKRSDRPVTYPSDWKTSERFPKFPEYEKWTDGRSDYMRTMELEGAKKMMESLARHFRSDIAKGK